MSIHVEQQIRTRKWTHDATKDSWEERDEAILDAVMTASLRDGFWESGQTIKIGLPNELLKRAKSLGLRIPLFTTHRPTLTKVRSHFE